MISKLINTAIKRQIEGSFIIDCNTSNTKDIIDDHLTEFKKLSQNIDKYIYRITAPKQVNECVRKTEFKPTGRYLHQMLIDASEIIKSPATLQKLLKFLEEPPKQTQTYIFTNNVNSLPMTIRSRCVTTHVVEKNKSENSTSETLKLIEKLKNKEISLSEFSLKTKKASLEDSRLLLMQVLSDNNLKKLSFSQIDYIHKMLIKINNYQKLNMPLLDNFLPIMRKLIELDNNTGRK